MDTHREREMDRQPGMQKTDDTFLAYFRFSSYFLSRHWYAVRILSDIALRPLLT